MAHRAKRGLLAQDLTSVNPWWRTTEWRSLDPQLRAAARAPFRLQPPVLADVAPPNLYTLRGPRRAGKSTVLKQTIDRLCRAGIDPRRICYFAADTLANEKDLVNLFQTAKQMFPQLDDNPRYFLIDEITSVPNWPSAIKWLRDNSQIADDCLVLSGSSSRDVALGAEQLAGRRGPSTRLDRLLLPLSFPEFLRCAGYKVPESPHLQLDDFYGVVGRRARDEALVYLDIFVAAFETYLLIGGFPQAVASFLETGSVSDGFARDLWDVVQADLHRAGMIHTEQALRLVERVNASLCGRLGFRELADALGVSHPTVGEWLSALADSYLLIHLYQEAGGMPAIDRQRKVYPTDPFLTQLPTRLSISSLTPEPSQVAESVLTMTLFRGLHKGSLDRFDAPSRLFYFRTSSGGEVDFLIHPGPMVAESKYVDDPSERETRAMVANFERGLLITRSAFEDTATVPVYPASIFCWLLDQGDLPPGA